MAAWSRSTSDSTTETVPIDALTAAVAVIDAALRERIALELEDAGWPVAAEIVRGMS